MSILYLSDILNVHDERLLSQFRAAGHSVTLLTFFHRAPELPKFIGDLVIAAAHATRGLKLLTSDNPDTVA